MGIAANDGHPRLGHALFRADDVHDALAHVVHGEIGHAEFMAIGGQRIDLDFRFRIVHAFGAVQCRHIVIGDRQRRLGTTNAASGGAQAFESLRAGHLMNQMPVDIEDACSVVLHVDQMALPNLIEKRLGHSFLSDEARFSKAGVGNRARQLPATRL